jgi:hypothetical protein
LANCEFITGKYVGKSEMAIPTPVFRDETEVVAGGSQVSAPMPVPEPGVPHPPGGSVSSSTSEQKMGYISQVRSNTFNAQVDLFAASF